MYSDVVYSMLIASWLSPAGDTTGCRLLMDKEANHQNLIGKYCIELVRLCVDSGEKSLPMCTPKKKLKPYWTDVIQPHKECSLFWHALWVNAGKPREGVLSQVMRQTRAKYHYFVRWAAVNQDYLCRSRMADSISVGDDRDFWRECKRMQGGNGMKCHEIDGVSGSASIAELFANKYRLLYNTAKNQRQALNDIQGTIESRIKCEKSYKISEITVEEVIDGINALNHDKTDGSERLFSNHLLLSSTLFRKHVADLFTAMLRHGYNPDYMLEAIISSIPKNRKESLNCSENYRGIALCSALCKVFDSIIIKRYYDQLMSNDLQFSFKAKHSTVMCTATLKEIASHYNAKGSQVFMCMLDATKAFDKVDFVKLFELLMRRDIPGVFLRLILDLYTRQRLKTAWNGAISLPFSVTNGVRQGGVLSPILFNVYFDELLQRLQDHDIGCHVGTKFVGALGYADDLTLLSPSLRGLQKAADICNDFAQEYSVKFNSKKTQCMCVGKDGEFFQGNIYLDGEKLKWVNCARHLGNLITWNLKDDDIQLKRGYFYGSVNNLCAKFKGILNNPDVASKLFYAHCCSFYGSQQWDLSSKSFDDICTAWQKAVRRIFNLPYRTHRYLLPYVVGREHIRDNLISRFENFFDSLMSSSNAIVQLLAYNAIFNNTPIGLNRKFVSSRNSARTDENEKGKGLLLCSLLKIRADHWYIPQFQRDNIDVLINSVCTE